jgi:hypothetical protein
VSGCAGLIPGSEAYENGGGGGYPVYGAAQAYPGDAGVGGGYAQPVQPYYQPQSYAYSGDPGVYAYQPAPPVPPAAAGYASPPPGRWLDRRQPGREDRIRPGLAAGQLTPREARRLQNEPGRIRGAAGRMRGDGNQGPQERPRLNGIQPRSSQDMYRLRHNGVQPGPTAHSRPTGPPRPTAQMRPGGQPRTAVPPQATVQPRGTAQPRAAAQPRTTTPRRQDRPQ